MASDHVDVIIIGAGAGGGACAWALTRKGLRVLVLEAGPAFDPYSDYRLHEENWEQQHFPEKKGSQGLYSYAPLQSLNSKWEDLRSWNHIWGRMNPSNVRRGGKYLHVRGVGGSTLHYSGEAHRLNPDNMQLRSRFGVGADWPLEYQELENYYQQAEELIGVAGGTSTHRPRKAPFPLPPHAPGYAVKKSWPAAETWICTGNRIILRSCHNPMMDALAAIFAHAVTGAVRVKTKAAQR